MNLGPAGLSGSASSIEENAARPGFCGLAAGYPQPFSRPGSCSRPASERRSLMHGSTAFLIFFLVSAGGCAPQVSHADLGPSPDMAEWPPACANYDSDAGSVDCTGTCSFDGRPCSTCGQTAPVPCKSLDTRICVQSCTACGPTCKACKYRKDQCVEDGDCCRTMFGPAVSCQQGVCEAKNCVASEGAACPKSTPQVNLCCNGLVCDPITLKCKAE